MDNAANMSRSTVGCVLAFSLLSSACGGPLVSSLDPSVDPENGTMTDPGTSSLSGAAKVGDYLSGTCSTSVVRPLSIQLVTELDCLKPGAVSEIPADNQIDASGILDYLQTGAGNSLPVVANARPSSTIHLNSALRSLAQQYLLYAWSQQGRCGISAAATPGNSNHERGLAVDIQDSSSWRSAFNNHSWRWLGSGDPVHYDYQGGGTVITGKSVQAFQRLWNANNPGDPISEDGVYGPQTGARIKKSPANGFPISNTCGQATFASYSFDMMAADAVPESCAL